jgi:hypothetical protein
MKMLYESEGSESYMSKKRQHAGPKRHYRKYIKQATAKSNPRRRWSKRGRRQVMCARRRKALTLLVSGPSFNAPSTWRHLVQSEREDASSRGHRDVLVIVPRPDGNLWREVLVRPKHSLVTLARHRSAAVPNEQAGRRFPARASDPTGGIIV